MNILFQSQYHKYYKLMHKSMLLGIHRGLGQSNCYSNVYRHINIMKMLRD